MKGKLRYSFCFFYLMMLCCYSYGRVAGNEKVIFPAGRSYANSSLANSITVSINSLQNMALVCKGNPFVLIAQVTQTVGAGDSDISNRADVRYEWY